MSKIITVQPGSGTTAPDLVASTASATDFTKFVTGVALMTGGPKVHGIAVSYLDDAGVTRRGIIPLMRQD